MIVQRRAFLTGLGSLLAAPAIVHASSLMPVKVLKPLAPAFQFAFQQWDPTDGSWRVLETISPPPQPEMFYDVIGDLTRGMAKTGAYDSTRYRIAATPAGAEVYAARVAESSPWGRMYEVLPRFRDRFHAGPSYLFRGLRLEVIE